jgi:hypothetical protein
MHTPDPTAYPPELEAAEAALLEERRRAIASCSTPPPSDQPPIPAKAPARLPDNTLGFGLSGGGIRSATFCLGLFQALAEHHRLGAIDFLSTVSGGGYFGSFLGRLYTRPWIHGVDDVEHVLRAGMPARVPEQHPGWAERTFRWLRDNGRYLAPRGSGDLLLLGAILLRNWMAVQLVMITTVLTVFVAAQIVRAWFDGWFMSQEASLVGDFLMCRLPGGDTLLWWSPWILLLAPVLIFMTVPAGWAYWLVTRGPDGEIEVGPAIGTAVVAVIGLAGVLLQYLLAAPGLQEAIGVPELSPQVLLWASVLLTLTAVLAFVYWLLGEYSVRETSTPTETDNLLRLKLTRAVKTGLLLGAAILGWTFVDTLGSTLYVVARANDVSLTRWAAALFGMFAGLGAFARPLSLLFGSMRRGSRPGVSLSVLSWAGAVVVLVIWLMSINVASHAIAWNFGPVQGAPPHLLTGSSKLLGADRLDVSKVPEGFVVTARSTPPPLCRAPAVQRPAQRSFSVVVSLLLTLFTVLFGRTRTFANMSSIHPFYAARLIRTFLGASNPSRLARDTSVTDTIQGDDCAGREYWNWPELRVADPATGSPHASRGWNPLVWVQRAIAPPCLPRRADGSRRDVSKPWTKGGPLHIVNATVNETVDARTKVQNQDRKGTSLAIGPCGLSLGIRHHLARPPDGGVVVRPDSAHDADSVYTVFKRADERGETPHPMSLGRWMSVSGAAFTAAAGANTTVPIAILSGMFNVRLGYWWDSGTPHTENSTWARFEQILPVQAALLAEMLAQTRGTAGRLWNLSDGGHFENMAGYELIRRRLPVIVIIDAEADPDYTFQGLSDLVRKARLDFKAEITFLNELQLSGSLPHPGGGSIRLLPASVRHYFGDLSALRRGRWSDEPVPAPSGEPLKCYTIEVDRTRVSRAHAALAKVEYLDKHDHRDLSWLVYVKATLMGDEPEDICHYHSAHPEFPQETTIDQFFDESQWESYRRLGLHIGHRVLTAEFFDHLHRLAALS